jgi:hypothetical protein
MPFDPVHHRKTLALFMALMCDRDLFQAVYGEDPANPIFNTAAFGKYFPTWKFSEDFEEALRRIQEHRVRVKQAQVSWFDVVGADYTGPACPTEGYLKSIVVSITL